MRLTSRSSSSSNDASSARSTPSARTVRSAIVSATASACSWISLSMNVSKPPFSAVSSSQSISTTSRESSSPSGVRNCVPSGVMTTSSPFSMYWTLRVWARKAGIAEARNVSPSPRPTTSGHSLRAPTSTSGSSRRMATKAKWPARTAHGGRARAAGVPGDEGEGAVELGVRGADRVDEVAGREVVRDEVGDDLGVGLVREDGAHVGEARLERHVVLDDAVDDDVDAARRVEVRVRVGLVDAAVRGPARVADAGRGRTRRERDRAFFGLAASAGDRLAQVVEIADRADRLDALALDHRDPGRVVAAVLEPGQPGEEEVLYGALADVSDDAAHGRLLSAFEKHSEPLCGGPGASITVPIRGAIPQALPMQRG